MPVRVPRKTRVFMVCSGLGVVRRGYESFMQACFNTLRAEGSLDVRLFKGRGASAPGETPLRHLGRDSFGARALGELLGRGPYVVEQATFTTRLLPHILRERPDVVYFCDPSIGKLLWHWRRWRGGNFRLLFSNSGPLPPPFPWADHVQQVTPSTVEEALALGIPLEQQTLVPCGLDFAEQVAPPAFMDQVRVRRSLGLPLDRPILLSVGALNRGHKRMDYLIQEVAALPSPRPYVVMLGQEEADTPSLRATATLMLGDDGFRMMTVSRQEVDSYYQAADLFVLASIKEGFGLAYAEALGYGLPCLAHDFPVSRYVMGDQGFFADFTERGALRRLIRSALDREESLAERVNRSETVRRRFSWDQLAPAYVELMLACAGTISEQERSRA